MKSTALKCAFMTGIILSTIALTAPSWTASLGLIHEAMPEGSPVLIPIAEGPSSENTSPNKPLPTPERAMKGASGDRRIKELHDQLNITPAQEQLWSAVTQVLQENAHTLEALHTLRSTKGGAMTAVEDLKSYAEIATAHANGLQKFIPVFEALYENMSEQQRRNADTLFSRRDPMAEDGTGSTRK